MLPLLQMSRFEYTTIEKPTAGKLVERKSRFLSFAIPVDTETQAEDHLREARKTYYDARHVCYAYILGRQQEIEKSSDNGEPSGTAGLPILNTIRRAGLTNILIIVVRYFGGIKLGTPGLIAAYAAAAQEALASAIVVHKIIRIQAEARFPFSAMGAVMQILNRSEARIVNTEAGADGNCILTLDLPLSILDSIRTQLCNIHRLHFATTE